MIHQKLYTQKKIIQKIIQKTPQRKFPLQGVRGLIIAIFLILIPFGAFSNVKEAYQWGLVELEFRSKKKHENPWLLDVVCEFKDENNNKYAVSGFYDGGNVWKVRFSPPETGAWTWHTSSSSDKSLSNKKGKFSVRKAPDNGNLLQKHGGLLKVSGNKKYLTYSDGTPFFWLGDTWWRCPDYVPIEEDSVHGRSMYLSLVKKRKKQGFNIVHWAFGFHNNVNYPQFMKTKDGLSFDVSYWQKVDEYVKIANEADIIPVIGFGFHTYTDNYSLEEYKYLWDYVVRRYGAYPVSWLICGEYNMRRGDYENRIKKMLELGQFIKDADPYNRAMTIHPWWYGGDTKDAWDYDWYDYIMWQGGHDGHNTVPPAAMYLESDAARKPYLEGEALYEGIHAGSAEEVTADDVRRVAWHAIQNGCFGYTYGGQGIWNASTKVQQVGVWGNTLPWWETLEFPAPDQLSVMKRFYEEIDWTKFRPNPDLLVLTGEYIDVRRPLLQTDNADAFIVYFPQTSGSTRNVAVKTRSGKYSLQWFNPSTGEKTNAGNAAAVNGLLSIPDRPDNMDWALTISPLTTASGDIQVATFYYPNWGAIDFTDKPWYEWQHISAWYTLQKARPRFEGHYQPKIPLWGYEDESLPEVMAKKIEAASSHGIDAFIFDWFYYDPPVQDSIAGGKRHYKALEHGFLNAPNNKDLKFALMWCNHNGGGRRGVVQPSTFEGIMDYVIETYFKHPSYWLIDGCPYFSVFDMRSLLHTYDNNYGKVAKAMNLFRSKVKAAGFKDLHFNGILSGLYRPGEMQLAIDSFGISSATTYGWTQHVRLPEFPASEYKWAMDAYFDAVKNGGGNHGLQNPAKDLPVPYHLSVIMGWDSSPMCGDDWWERRTKHPYGPVIINNTPKLFREALIKAKEETLKKPEKDRIITINAWNEWWEGSYLEPDTITGMKYLEAVKEVFGNQ